MYQYNRTVRFVDTDAAGVVYFARIVSICHEAYESSLEDFGINLQEFFSKGAIAYGGASPIAVPIVHAEADFFAPLFCGDKLLITLTKTLVSDSEFEITYQIFRETAPAKVLSRGKTRHVCISTETRTRTPLPDFLQQWIEFSSQTIE